MVTRTIACAIDLAIVVGVVIAGYIGWSGFLFILDPSDFVWPEPGFALLFLIGGTLLILYLGLSWWGTGRSYGNQVLGLRVVNFRGERLLLPTALLRAAFCVVFPIGLYWCLVSRANRSLADVALRTSVIYDWQVRPAKPSKRRE